MNHGHGRVRWDYEVPCSQVEHLFTERYEFFHTPENVGGVLDKVLNDIRFDFVAAGHPAVHGHSGEVFIEHQPIRDSFEVTLYLLLCFECDESAPTKLQIQGIKDRFVKRLLS